MKKELRDIAWALRWYYKEDAGRQYSPDEVRKYDESAAILTQREEYGHFLAAQIKNPGSTLEIAAGTGLVSQALSKTIPDIVFTDISQGALDVLRERLQNPSVIQRADFLDLPYEDKSFDTVICVGGYRYVDNDKKAKFWEEMERVIRPEGRLFIGQFYPKGFLLRGSDVSMNGIKSSFQHRSLAQFTARVDLHPGKIVTGHYLTFEFGLGIQVSSTYAA